jgi:hypothetical protein
MVVPYREVELIALLAQRYLAESPAPELVEDPAPDDAGAVELEPSPELDPCFELSDFEFDAEFEDEPDGEPDAEFDAAPEDSAPAGVAAAAEDSMDSPESFLAPEEFDPAGFFLA